MGAPLSIAMSAPMVTPNPTANAEALAPGVSPDVEPEIVVSNASASSDGPPQECFANYTSSFMPFLQIMKNPIAHLGKGCGGIFACSHEDEETFKLAIGAWFAIKFYFVILESILQIIFVGVIIGYMGSGIAWFLIGLILGFFASHLMWWISCYYMVDICCSNNRYVVPGVISGISGVLDICFGFLSHLGVYNIWIEYLSVDIAATFSAICSIWVAALLIQTHLKYRSGGETRPEENGNAYDPEAPPPPATVVTLPAEETPNPLLEEKK